ncbi:MAG: winged helix-turn-helix domain-containing protein [Nitrososphaerales archaeon]
MKTILEIDIEVLRSIREGNSHPTLIMHRAKLSWSEVVESLQSLLKVGAIALSMSKNYELTEKGIRILENYDSVRRAFGEILT